MYNTHILLLDLTYVRTMVYVRAQSRRPDSVSAIRRCLSVCRWHVCLPLEGVCLCADGMYVCH